MWFLPSALIVNVMRLDQAQVNGGSDCAQGSQLPRHLIADAREWIDEGPNVPIPHSAKPQQGERAWNDQVGKNTLLSLTLPVLSG